MRRLPHHARYPYSPIKGRPTYRWPNGAGLALYIAVNLEVFAFGEGLGAELAPGGGQPDVLNYAWREYGNRVGAWRMIDLLDALNLPASVLVNSDIYAEAPGLVDAFRARGDEIVGHGRTNSERQGSLSEMDEAALIDEATRVLTRAEGRAPKGWLGPWISESRATPDLLAARGYSYLLDWAMDDQPVFMDTRAGKILALPYPQEINDIPQIVARKIEAPAFADMIIDQFDEMLGQARAESLVMGVALHPLRHLRRALSHIAERRADVWLTTAGAIADHAWARRAAAPEN